MAVNSSKNLTAELAGKLPGTFDISVDDKKGTVPFLSLNCAQYAETHPAYPARLHMASLLLAHPPTVRGN